MLKRLVATIMLSFGLMTASEAAGVSSYPAGNDGGVHVIASTGSSVTVEYLPLVTKSGTVRIEGHVYTKFGIQENNYGVRMHPGTPESPERVITVRLTGTMGNTVEVLQSSYEDIPGTRLAPVPAYNLRSKSETASGALADPRYLIDRAAYGIQTFTPADLASLRNIGAAQSGALATLALHPLQFNPGTSTVRRYTRIVVRVNFGPADNIQRVLSGLSDQGVAINDLPVSSDANPRSVQKTSTLTNSVLTTGEWFRFPVTDDGMYKLTGATLLGLGISSSTDPRTIRIFGYDGKDLPGDPTIVVPDDLPETAVQLIDGVNPGHLDAEDYVVFFAKSAKGWNYKASNKTFTHYQNHFSTVNYYWITYGGSSSLQMATDVAASGASAYHPLSVPARLFREDEKINIISSGLEWLGQSLAPGENVTYNVSMPGIDLSEDVQYLFQMYGRSPSQSSMAINEHTLRIGTAHFYGISLDEHAYQVSVDTIQVGLRPTFGSVSQLKFTYISPDPAGTGYLDWYEVSWKRHLAALNDVLSFTTQDTTGTAQYDITSFSGAGTVYDVSMYNRPVIIPGSNPSAGTCSFTIGTTAGSIRELYVVGPAGYVPVTGLARVANQNLHGDPNAVANIIITHPDFMSAAQRLKAHRESAIGGSIPTTVVDITQIYNEFGGGIGSPAAVRNYLKYRYMNAAKAPQFVLLFGDGDFDYKRIIGTGPNWIPAWETPESFDPLSSYPSEDAYGILTSGGRINVGLGRLTSQTMDDANTMVDKIIEYESARPSDPWIMKTTFVADDGPQAPGVNDYFAHTDDAENASSFVPAVFNKSKIYEYQYPTLYTATGRRKPEVNDAIVNAINNGTLILNFNGHGNPRLWAHEAVFVRETDFPRLHNKGRYFFLTAATCNYSNFDAINDQSGGEQLLSMTGAGAIGVFSANRAVFESQNAALNQTLMRSIFRYDSHGRLLPVRLGTIDFLSKQNHIDENDRKFFLLGDPAMQLALPELAITVDSINHRVPSSVIQLSALQSVGMQGTVLDTGGAVSTFNGNSLVEVFDASKNVTISDSYENDDGTFTMVTDSFRVAGEVLFRGQSSVSSGRLSSAFVVPKDISYGAGTGRVNFYCWNAQVDGAGSTSNVVFGGTDSTAAIDTQGPQLQMYLGSRSFRTGDVVAADPTLLVDLQDEHGVNTSGSGIGHRLEAWLDGATESIDLSSGYRSAVDDYRRGTVTYPLTGLTEGTHRLKMRAWDTYNNASVAEVSFDVISGAGLQITNIMNYPNPCSGPTIFTFEQNQPGNVSVTVKVYTVAGRLIQSLEPGTIASTDKLVRVPWDGRDRDGSTLANGVYLYKVLVQSSNGRYSSEAYGKLTVVR